MPSYKAPSVGRITGVCGDIKMGSFIKIPATSRNSRLAGFFCLNIPITDIADFIRLVLVNYTPASQNKYNFY